MVANAVDADDPAIERRPARDLDPDSDLGDLPVTISVGRLSRKSVTAALNRGAAEARRLRVDAALSLQGEWRISEAA